MSNSKKASSSSSSPRGSPTLFQFFNRSPSSSNNNNNNDVDDDVMNINSPNSTYSEQSASSALLRSLSKCFDGAMEDAVLDDNRNEITSDNNNDKKDFPKWGPSHSASDDETQDDDDNHNNNHNNHNNQNNKKMILSSMKLFKSSQQHQQQQQQQQQQRSTSNSSYSNRTHPSNTNSTSTAPTAPITTSTNANVRRNNHNSLALKTGMQSPHTPNTNDTNINNYNNNTSTVAAATTTTTTSMGGTGAAATNFWNFNVRSYDEEGAVNNNNNNDATIVIKSPTATSTATHIPTATPTPTPTATMNPTTHTGNNNTSSSPLLSSPVKAAADAVKGMIDSLTQQVNQASAKAQEMKLPSFTMPNINMNSMNINMNMNSVTMAGVGLGGFCGPSSNHGNNNNSNNNLDETMDDTNKTSFSTYNNNSNSNSNYTSSPRTTTVGKKTKSILGKIPEDFGFCGDQSSNATNNNNNGCMIMDGGDGFIGGMMNFIDGNAGGKDTGRGGGIHLHHGNDHEEEIVDIDNEEDGIINNYDTPTANTTTITTTAPMSPERDKGYEIRLKSTFSLLELKHQKEQKKKEKMMSSARQQQQQQQQQQQMMKKKKPFPTLPELPMDDIMEGGNNDPESHCVNNNKAASRKSGGGRRSPTLSAFGRTHPNNKSQQQQHQQQHYMDPSSSQHTPQDLSQGGLPFEFLTVPTGKDVDLERSVSELTMRSHGAYEKHRYSSDSRRMAYYAVGRVNNLDSNDPNNNAKGGNRRCYFTGISIPYGMPFYAGSVQQGPRTLVVFCLPSALGLPSLHPQPLHHYSKTDRERYLQTLPESNDALIEEMKRRYSESFDTLPVQVKSPHCWRLFVKFCFFSGLPIAEGEMHYRVKNSVMVFPLSYEHQQQQHVLPSSSPGPSSSPTSTENKSKSAQPSNAKGDTNDISSTPSHTMHKEEIALSHEVLEAINGEASAEILRLPNQKTFDYLKGQYSQQSAKLNDDVFDRKSWEIVLPEV